MDFVLDAFEQAPYVRQPGNQRAWYIAPIGDLNIPPFVTRTSPSAGIESSVGGRDDSDDNTRESICLQAISNDQLGEIYGAPSGCPPTNVKVGLQMHGQRFTMRFAPCLTLFLAATRTRNKGIRIKGPG